MAESRKRSHSVEEDQLILKKRIISDENGSPRVNGVGRVQTEDVEPTADDKLELFRKEAIYRRMLHYSRENENCQRRISELEERKNTCEAGLAAMSACWMQLVDAIRVLVDPPTKRESDEPQTSPSTQDLEELYTLSRYVSADSMPELQTALEKSRYATQDLVARVVQRASSNASQDVVLMKYQKAQTESAALRAQVEVLQVRLSDSEEVRSRLAIELAAANNRVERLKSKTVQANLPKAGTSTTETQEVTDETLNKPSSPAPNGATPRMIEEWEEKAAVRGRLLREQDKVIEDLKKKCTSIELNHKLKPLTKSDVISTPFYQRVLQRSAAAFNAASEKEDEVRAIKAEFAQYSSEREKYEDELRTESANAINETLTLIARRDADNVRLREERDQRTAELHERRNKESVKMASCEEFKTLAASRADRISALESQLHRSKLKLAANAGREDILKFLIETPDKNIEFVDHLQSRLLTAESRLATLEQSLSKLDQDHPDVAQLIRSEADALQRLTEVTAQLKNYQTVFGELSSAQPDIPQMTSQLQRKEEELNRLRFLDNQHAQVEAALYSEIEKLSSAWEVLDGQVKSKILDLSGMEERLTKAAIERAKSDNKFYAAVREKEIIEAERKNAARGLEKQMKVNEAQRQFERVQAEQLKAAKEELEKYTAWCTDTHDNQLRAQERKLVDLSERANVGAKIVQVYKDTMKEQEDKFLKQQENLRQSIEANERATSALEKEKLTLQSKAKFDSSRHSNKQEDPDAQLMALLKCSTCNLKFRDTILTKCSHTFCRACVDARISSRQRKCPACGLGFAQSDVLKIFMQ